jgi:hypothetical protein
MSVSSMRTRHSGSGRFDTIVNNVLRAMVVVVPDAASGATL